MIKRRLTVIALFFVMILVLSVSVSAKYNVPDKVRMYTNKNGLGKTEVNLELDPGTYVKIASAKGLYSCKITQQHWVITENYINRAASTATILVMTKKNGTYSIILDVYNGKTNKKIASITMLVYAYPDKPVKKVVINGKPAEKFKQPTTAKTASVKINMNPGYELKRVEYGVAEKPVTTTHNDSYSNTTRTNGEIVYKTFENGSKIKLGTLTAPYYEYYDEVNNAEVPSKAYVYFINYNDIFLRESTDILDPMNMAATYIRITYADKYTHKDTTDTVYTIYKKIR